MTTKVSRRPLHHGVLPYESSSRGDGTPTSLARSRNGQSRNTAAGKFPFQYLIIIAAFLMMLSWQLSQGHAHHFSRLADSHEVPPMSLKPTNLPSLIGEPLLSSHPIMINVTDVDNAITIDARKAETTGLSSSSSIRVAYAISVTSCPSGNTTWTAVVDGPAVLAYSIQKLPSRYAHDLVAIVHPNATSCVDHLPRFGYKIIVKELGFKLREIKNKWSYRKYIKYQGCCEEFEFIKLEAFDLTDYDVVLHLDTDLLILQPMDGIVDAMMGFNKSAIDVLHKDRPLPGKITFLYTRDYVQMSRLSNETHKLAVQGGFFAVTPSHRLYRKLIKTVESGNFDMLAGWARKGYGGYYGAAQIQGMLSYWISEREPQGAVELNPCIYNAMVSFPPHTHDGRCRYGRAPDYCQDCRDLPLSALHSTHYTVCYKPWICAKHKYFCQLCRDTHRAWFATRREMELSWGRSVPTEGWNFNTTMGYCISPKKQGYLPLQIPSTS